MNCSDFWKLGQARKNNGVLLLVAPAEHKVRIEVGYGLEGSLTDALSSVIISSVIVPRFKANDYSGGIERGVDAIVSVLTTDASGWHQTVSVRPDDRSSTFDKLTTVFFALLVIVILRLMWDPSGGRRGSLIFTPGSSGGGGFSGRNSGGGQLWRRLLGRWRIIQRGRCLGEFVMQLSWEDRTVISASTYPSPRHTER